MPKAEIPAVFEGRPVLTAEQARRLDAQATSRFGIPAETLMERAGAAVAEETERLIGGRAAGKRVVVCCGRGANGGDGLVAARVLAAKGAVVTVFLCPPKKDAGYPALVRGNLDKAKAAGAAVHESGETSGLPEALAAADAAVDALLGTGSSGKPAGAVHHMIQELTRSKKPVVAVDVPSGLHPDTGHHSGAFVSAAVTVTFGWAKRGLLAAHAQRNVGVLKVVDIGYPPELRPA